MLDADGNEMVEKKEFFKVSRFYLFLAYKTLGCLCDFTFPLKSKLYPLLTYAMSRNHLYIQKC